MRCRAAPRQSHRVGETLLLSALGGVFSPPRGCGSPIPKLSTIEALQAEVDSGA